MLFIGAPTPSVLDEALTRPADSGARSCSAANREDRKDIAAFTSTRSSTTTPSTPSRREDLRASRTATHRPISSRSIAGAAVNAFEDGRDSLYWKDIASHGQRGSRSRDPSRYTERDKIAVSRHELGHAVASHFFQKTTSHVRLSIRRRANPQIGEIGGYHKSCHGRRVAGVPLAAGR